MIVGTRLDGNPGNDVERRLYAFTSKVVTGMNFRAGLELPV